MPQGVSLSFFYCGLVVKGATTTLKAVSPSCPTLSDSLNSSYRLQAALQEHISTLVQVVEPGYDRQGGQPREDDVLLLPGSSY